MEPEGEIRINFHEELERAEGGLMSEGTLVRRQLHSVLDALERRDGDIAAQVVAEDDRVDDVHIATETRIMSLLALQAPVATDLRLIRAIMHANSHLERMGDLCVNMSKFVLAGHSYPPDSPMVDRLREMGVRSGEMLDIALASFAGRDLRLAESLPVKDNAIDRLNRGMLDDLKQYVDDEASFEWATNIVLVSRYLERFADHAVDIGEQVSYLVTGVLREFEDASHPETSPDDTDSREG
ncbi:MAG: phosphate signaling complex protein PhoU [Actinomycetota bacterium]